MYLSKVNLCHSQQAKAALLHLGKNGAYATHQLLWKLFTDSQEREFLFREERTVQGLPIFYVLSTKEPINLPELFEVQTKLYAPKLQQRDRLAYKLRVNPTIAIKSASGKSQRHDVLMNVKWQAKDDGVSDVKILQPLMNQAAQSWLANERRLNEWGIQLDVLPDIESYSQHRVVRSKGNIIKFSSVDMQGVLTVIKPDRFLVQLISGFGRAKSLGCGLMLIRRI